MPTERDLVEALGAAVGQQKAREMLRRAADRLGLPAGELSPEVLPRVLEELTLVPGVIGLAARRALVQLWRANTPPQAPAAPSEASPPRPKPRQTSSRPDLGAPAHAEPAAPARTTSGVRAAARAPVSVADLCELLSRSLGEAKAQELVRGALEARSWRHNPLPPGQALTILDDLSQEPGLVGITARFAKPKLLLRTGT